jgi:RHS repeat-associated protein
MAAANLYLFSSKEYHQNSGLVYYLKRYYDPSCQRWLNKDPIGNLGGVYLYCFIYNDPLNIVDPWGLKYAELYSGYGAATGVGATAVASVAVDAATGGVNIAATPAELAVGGLIGAAIGRAIGTVVDQITGNDMVKSPTPFGPPPVAVPGGDPDTVWAGTGPQREGVPSWVPFPGFTTPDGSSPSASWDPFGGHWDVDDGYGNRQRYDWRGNPIDADAAHDPDAASPPKNNPCP